MDLSYKKAGTDDIDVIYRLAKKIWNVHYPSIISQQQIDYMLEMMYSPAALNLQMHANCHFTIVSCDGVPAGYISYEEENKGEFFIHKFYVDTTLHKKGIGTALFGTVFDILPGKKLVKLYVNRENYKPINFYFKLGFKIEGIINKEIGNNYFMNDFLMIKHF
jgi:ribosomal protein S18 acetylase RimI-like enzyme